MSYPDRALSHIEKLGVIDIYDYADYVYNSDIYCFHIKLVTHKGELYDGVGCGDTEVLAASKACSEVLERQLFGHLNHSKVIFGSSFHPNEIVSRGMAKTEAFERIIFSEFLKFQYFKEKWTEGEFEFYVVEYFGHSIVVCSWFRLESTGVGISFGCDRVSVEKAKSEAIRRGTFFCDRNLQGDNNLSNCKFGSYQKVLDLDKEIVSYEYQSIDGLGVATKVNTKYSSKEYLDYINKGEAYEEL